MSAERTPVEKSGPSAEPGVHCTYQVPFGGPRCPQPSYRNHDGHAKCIFHYPGYDKGSDFYGLFKAALTEGGRDLRGTWFPGDFSLSELDIGPPVDLSYAVFNGRADFGGTVFRRDVSFSYAHFKSVAVFSGVRFKGDAAFDDARFGERAYFYRTVFESAADFLAARFGGRAVFELARFGPTTRFARATFDDEVEFAGLDDKPPFTMDATVDLQFARFRKPQGVRFQTLTLMPHWFVNVDAQEFQFVDVGWNVKVPLKKMVDALKARGVIAADRMLSRAVRHLAVNAEQNHRYDEASQFRYLALDAKRRATYRGWPVWTLLWWYWIASGYGERGHRAFAVLVVLWIACAALYTQGQFAQPIASVQVSAPLQVGHALTYSAAVLLLQKPEPPPSNMLTQCVVLGETLLGPLLIGLMALAIRRQFMR